jgi:putative hydrolase of the HAD superfamily
VKALIFDLDDTLFPEKQYVFSGFHHVSQIISQRFKINAETVFLKMENLFNESSKNVFNRTLELLKISFDGEVIKNLVFEYRNHKPEISFYDDVIPFLEKIKRKGYKTGIITDGYKEAQNLKIKALEAEKYFNFILITDEFGEGYKKPGIKSFELMKEKLSVEYEDMIYIGDNPEKDFYISRIYPIKTVRIQREGVYRDKGYLENIKENFLIHSLAEIIVLFDI